MGAISRGIKNAFRNGLRTLSIVLILAISLGMSLVMLMSLKAVQSKIDSVKGTIGNNITVSPAGARGFEGGGTPLAGADITTLSKIANVSKVTTTISARLTSGTDTPLASAIDPGTLGNRNFGNRGGDANGSGNNSNGAPRTLTLPISVTGTNDLSTTAALNASSFSITSGSAINPTSSDHTALVGSALATKNNLAVGSTFKMYNTDITVSGIFDAGNEFTNSGIVMPIATVQALSSQPDQITEAIVQVNSIDNVATVTSDIKTAMGTKADVVSQQDSSNQAIAPLQNIKTISLYSLIGSLVAGAVIILLTMMMIVRERRREIGVLKAIGSTNIKVVTQFISESLVLTLISSVIGIILGFALSNPVLKVLLNNAESSTRNTAGGPGGFAGRIANFGGGAGNLLRNLNATVGYEIILYGLAAAIVIAIIGSAIPAFIIAKVRPAEVMRAE